MNELDEGGEGATECARLQAVLGFEDRGPAHLFGGRVGVPDPDARRLQGKPHALFGGSQGLDRLWRSVMSLPELKVPMTSPEPSRSSVLRHSTNRSSPDLVRRGATTDREIAGDDVVELCSELDPHPGGQAGVDEVAPDQVALRRSQEIAAFAVDQPDPPSRSRASRMTSAVSRYNCARSRSYAAPTPPVWLEDHK